MNDLIQSFAHDLSVQFSDIFGENEPADGYYDPLINVLGSSPTKGELEKVWRERIPVLQLQLSKCLEFELDEKITRQVIKRAIINFFGKDFEFGDLGT